MLQVKQLCVGSMQANCYLVWDETSKCVIIDPGDDPEYIAEKISSFNLRPKFLLATHGHFDHILAVTGLKLIFNIPFLCSKKDEFLVRTMAKRAKFWQKNKQIPAPHIDTDLLDGKNITFGKSKLKVLATPGHTPGGVSFFNEKENLLFSGDTLFKQSIGRTDLSYSSPELLQESLKKILNLPSSTVVYPGHGESTSIGEEKSVNYPY